MWHWLTERIDKGTSIMLAVLSVVSVVAVYSATHGTEPRFFSGPAAKQLFFVVLGFVVFWIVQKVDYHDWADLAFIFYWVGIGLLVLVLIFARPIANTRSWFDFGFVRLQPSEPMKALVALAAAAYLADSPLTLDFKRLVRLAGLIALPIALILLQPDMGSALTFTPLFLGIAWVAGLKPRVLVTLALIAALAAPVGWFYVLKPYQKERVLTVFNPERDPMGAGYQAKQSRIAVGSGMVTGRGLFQGSQSRLEFLPARETDFILGVIAEETGFIGVLAVLGLYAGLLLRGLSTAFSAQDYLGTLIAVGVVVVWAGQLFINTGMVTGTLPTIGVPLPGVSYGGSSVLATYIAFGFVASVRGGRLVNA